MSKANGGKKKRRKGAIKRIENGTIWGSGQRSEKCQTCGVGLPPGYTLCGICSERQYGPLERKWDKRRKHG